MNPKWETNGIVGLFSNNPMLRYRTSNGPITCRMGLMALSTMQQSQNAYLPAKPQTQQHYSTAARQSVTRESVEMERENRKRE